MNINNDQHTFDNSEKFDRSVISLRGSNLLSEALGRALADESVSIDNVENNNSECLTFQANGEIHSLRLTAEQASAFGLKFVDISTTVPSISNEIINQEVEFTKLSSPVDDQIDNTTMQISSIEDSKSEIISYQEPNLNPISLLYNPVRNELDDDVELVDNNSPVTIESISNLINYNKDMQTNPKSQVEKVRNNLIPLSTKQQTGTLIKRTISNNGKTYYITPPNKKLKLEMLQPVGNKKILNNIQLTPAGKINYVNVNNAVLSKPRSILPKQILNTGKSISNTSLVSVQKLPRVKSLLNRNILDNKLKPVEVKTSLINQNIIKLNKFNNTTAQTVTQAAIASPLLLKDKIKIASFPMQNNQTGAIPKINYSTNWTDSKIQILNGHKNLIVQQSKAIGQKTLANEGKNIIFNGDKNIDVNKNKYSPKSFAKGFVEEKLNKMPVKNDKMPLGSTDNPYKLIQKGDTFHSVQHLNEQQLQQIAGFLKKKPRHQPNNGSREPHKLMLYDSATNKKVVFRVVYPEELDLKEDPKPGVEGDAKSIKSRGRPKGKSKCPSPIQVETPSSRPPARTRSGRVTRPPPRMVQDYKRLRPEDSDREDSLDNLDNINSSDDTPDYQPHIQIKTSIQQEKTFSDSEVLLSGIQKKERNIKSQYICPTCNKIYLGYSRMSRHLEINPDHGDIEKLGIKPKAPIQKTMKKQHHHRGRGRHFLKQNAQNIQEDKNPKLSENDENTEICNLNNSDDLLSTLNLTEVKAKQSTCDMTTDLNKDSEYNSNILPYNNLSLFDMLLLKLNSSSKENRIDTLCVELVDLIEKVKNVTSQSLFTANTKLENIIRCEIPESISSVLGINPGSYNMDETVLDSKIQEVVNKKFEGGLSTPIQNSDGLISSTYVSPTVAVTMDNHTLENMEIDMTCNSNNDEFINKNIPINILVSDHELPEIHSTDNHLIGHPKPIQCLKLPLVTQPSVQENCSEVDSTISLQHNSLNMNTTEINILRPDISMNEDEYQTVDELVSERLQNLTADELAVPPLNTSRSTLDTTGSQQLTCTELPLDFLFTHS